MGVMLGIRNMLNIIFVDWISQYTRKDRAIRRKGCLNEKGVQFIDKNTKNKRKMRRQAH